MMTWFDVLAEQERRRAYVAEAEKERLIRQALSQNAPRAKSYQRWLAHLGARLVTWGYRLQARYNHTLAVSTPLGQERYVAESNTSPCAG
jgi:hypothetical protein